MPVCGNEAVRIRYEERKDALFTRSGDVLRYAIPASALGYSLAIKDGGGVKNWALSVGSAVALTEGLKYAVGRPRPYQGAGEVGRSFPSGHTAMAFAGAAYWQRRYGWEIGGPAYLLAAAVGYSRVWSGYHYWSDVAAGAVIGAALPYLFTKPYDKVQISAAAEPAGGGRLCLSFRF